MVINGVDWWLTLLFLFPHWLVTAVMVVWFDDNIAGAESRRDSFGGR